MDKAYPTLDDEARQQLALQGYLSELDNDRVAFIVKQQKLRIIEAAVGATLECESYLIRHNHSGIVVAPVQSESRDSALMDMMTQLMAWMDKLETNSKLKIDSTVIFQTGDKAPGGVLLMWPGGSFCMGCAQPKRFTKQGNWSPLGRLPCPQEKI